MNIFIKKSSRLSKEDVENVRNFLISCYVDQPEVHENFYRNSYPTFTILFIEEEKIVSHASIVKRVVNYSGKDFVIGGVGNIAVHPDYRNKGVGTQLLESVANTISDQEYELGLLFCHPKLDSFYTRSNWIKKQSGKIQYIQNGETIHERTSYILPVSLSSNELESWLSQDICVGESSW